MYELMKTLVEASKQAEDGITKRKDKAERYLFGSDPRYKGEFNEVSELRSIILTLSDMIDKVECMSMTEEYGNRE